MKRRPAPPSKPSVARRVVRQRGAGKDIGTHPKKPTPGWKGHPAPILGWRNPRPPAVPATLDIQLNEYYTAATIMGLLAGQTDEPDKKWCRDWSLDMGEMLAAGAYRLRRKSGRGRR